MKTLRNWGSSSPSNTRARSDGYSATRLSSTSRTVDPAASTWRRPPASGRRTGGMRTCGIRAKATRSGVVEAVDRRERGEEPGLRRREPDRDRAAGDDRRHRAEQRGRGAGLERAELVRGADEDPLDREHAPAQLVRGRERDGGRADVHAEHVGEAADGERDAGERQRAREPEDDHARPERGDGDEQRPADAVCERPAREHDPGEQRARRRGAAQDAEADRARVEDGAGEQRQQRLGPAEEDGEEVERMKRTPARSVSSVAPPSPRSRTGSRTAAMQPTPTRASAAAVT